MLRKFVIMSIIKVIKKNVTLYAAETMSRKVEEKETKILSNDNNEILSKRCLHKINRRVNEKIKEYW